MQSLVNYGLIFASTCGLILGIGFCANILVFSLFARFNSLHKNCLDLILLNMALADFLNLLLLPFTIYISIYRNWSLGDTFCKIYQFFLAFSLAASTYSLCAVSFARAMIIIKPHQPPEINFVIFMLFLVWALSFFISFPLRIFATNETGMNVTFCLPTLHEHHYQVVLGQFTFYYLFPMLVITFNYIRLAKFLHKSPMMSRVSSRNTRRASIMIFLAAATFSVCWLPGYMLELCVYLGLYCHSTVWDTFYFICTVLQYLHPCVNPVLYVLLSKRYRHIKVSWLLNCSKTKVQPQIISITE
ncbi:galanin receptor 2b [Polypterus senegalus]|uniref:galanin receptor 2b n=1 Tax=Polypterus senegalus TaxID=55291 RepID=UPI001964B1CB|nr:galanin receptor 2b [Polypterus senegalus]